MLPMIIRKSGVLDRNRELYINIQGSNKNELMN